MSNPPQKPDKSGGPTELIRCSQYQEYMKEMKIAKHLLLIAVLLSIASLGTGTILRVALEFKLIDVASISTMRE